MSMEMNTAFHAPTKLQVAHSALYNALDLTAKLANVSYFLPIGKPFFLGHQ